MTPVARSTKTVSGAKHAAQSATLPMTTQRCVMRGGEAQ
jgi:hypothetical protein